MGDSDRWVVPLVTGFVGDRWTAIAVVREVGKIGNHSGNHTLSNNSGSIPAWRRAARSVPSGTSPGWFGIVV